MTIRWILIGLFSLCSHYYCQDCKPELQENVEFKGTYIQLISAADVEHCQLLCTHHPSCLFFTFYQPDYSSDRNRHYKCSFQSSTSGTPHEVRALLGVTSGYSLKACTSNERPCLSKVYQNVDFPGADFKNVFTSDYKECQRACNHQPSCQSFTFLNEAYININERYKCNLKFNWNVPLITPRIVRTAGIVSGFSHNSLMTRSMDAGCRTKLFPNTDIPGSDFLELPASSPEHCLALCSAHPSCTYFTYDSQMLKCHLKHNLVELNLAVKMGITSGLPTRYCQPDNSWVKVPLQGMDFHGSDIRYEIQDDQDSCQRSCTDDPSCQFYAYLSTNFHDPNYWRRCYLKRTIVMPNPPAITKLPDAVSGFSSKNCGV